MQRYYFSGIPANKNKKIRTFVRMKLINSILRRLSALIAVAPLCTLAQGFCTVTTDDQLVIIEFPSDSRLEFTIQRPSETDADVLLCIPAAFITPEGGVQGAYAIGGQQHGRYNRHSKVSIDGRTFSLASTITTGNGFQQMCLVRNHQPVHFRDERRRIRRALCKENERSPAFIVESQQPLTMNEFAQMLSKRVAYAVYTDVGSHGYGWYRAASSPSYLSAMYFYKKGKQNNWLVCRRT